MLLEQLNIQMTELTDDEIEQVVGGEFGGYGGLGGYGLGACGVCNTSYAAVPVTVPVTIPVTVPVTYTVPVAYSTPNISACSVC